MERASGDVGRVAGVLFVALLFASAVAGSATALAAADDHRGDRLDDVGAAVPAGQQGPTGPALAQSNVDPDVVVMRVHVTEDGDARWQVEYRVRLDDKNTTAAFNSVRADIEENASAYTREFASRMRQTVRTAANRTGREMALRNVTVTATNETLPQLYGVITYRFTWTNFAAVESDRLRMGGALAGLYLDAESSLTISWPATYETTTVVPDPTATRENAVVWRGPIDFGTDEPRIVVERAGGLPTMAIVGAVVLVLVALAVGWIVVRRMRTKPASEAPTGEPSAEAGTGSPEGSDAAETSGVTSGGDATGGTAESESEGGEPPAELLSNEEKVLRLLDERGGRVKQQEIASEYDWTDAKTSQVVGKLRDEGEVETFRIGRENVVTLPEESDL
ncbi:MAG: DUF4897 domain-containing protein [Haloarculaceae archaeon]